MGKTKDGRCKCTSILGRCSSFFVHSVYVDKQTENAVNSLSYSVVWSKIPNMFLDSILPHSDTFLLENKNNEHFPADYFILEWYSLAAHEYNNININDKRAVNQRFFEK